MAGKEKYIPESRKMPEFDRVPIPINERLSERAKWDGIPLHEALLEALACINEGRVNTEAAMERNAAIDSREKQLKEELRPYLAGVIPEMFMLSGPLFELVNKAIEGMSQERLGLLKEQLAKVPIRFDFNDVGPRGWVG